MNISIPKLKAIILYFASNTDNKFLGKVKLMKLLYFLDFGHVKKFGSPVTYDKYVNLEHGPIPSTIKNLVDTAEDDADSSLLSEVINIEHPEGTNMCRIIPRRKLSEKDMSYFTEGEIKVLENVCKRFGDKTTKYTEDQSHEEAPWKETKLLEYIPYELAAKDKDCLVSLEEIQLLLSMHPEHQ